MAESAERARLFRTALRLCLLTVAYNVVEGVLSILFGAEAGSSSLVGFGLDSGIESLSGGIMIWRILRRDREDVARDRRLERTATRLVGLTFFALAAYVGWESVRKLVLAERPAPSPGGLIITAISALVMPGLAWLKFRTARRLGSRSLEADSKETLACAFLSVSLLLGLAANALFGLWQADPVAGLVITAFLLREGFETWREDD